MAAAAFDSTCSTVTKSFAGIAVVLIVFVVLLLGGLIWMVRRQRAYSSALTLDFTKQLMTGDELDEDIEVERDGQQLF